MANPTDVIPVVEEDGEFKGVILKRSFSEKPPFQMILVDHNEIEQSLPGAKEIPVIEVVDHHRIGMMPTAEPIRFTGDIVGSTCTLVASMFRSSGESLSPEMAGLLLGGLVSDTLLLKSPTAAELDFKMCEWLEKVSGVKGGDLMDELLKIDSPLASKPAGEVLNADRKNYTDGNIRFALAQVEESNLELLHRRREELCEAIRQILADDHLDFFGVLVTDAVRINSEFLVLGDRKIIRHLPFVRLDDELFALPGVLSRKNQLLPQILSVTGAFQK
jgi:manganese-dependent inorganic pyrophosphatase